MAKDGDSADDGDWSLLSEDTDLHTIEHPRGSVSGLAESGFVIRFRDNDIMQILWHWCISMTTKDC